MTGALIYKDALTLWKSSKTVLLLTAVFLAAAVLYPDNLFFAVYPAVALSTLGFNSLSYDQRWGWDRCAGTLPYGRRRVITAKYLLALMTVGAAVLLYGLTGLLAWAIHGTWGGMAGWLFNLEMLLAVTTLYVTVMYPIALRFGMEKARILYILLICGGTVLLTMYTPVPGVVSSGGLGGAGAALALLLACCLLWAASWVVSQRIYRNREL